MKTYEAVKELAKKITEIERLIRESEIFATENGIAFDFTYGEKEWDVQPSGWRDSGCSY